MNKIRKFGIIAALLAVVTILVPLPARLDTAFASETASDAIIQEARNEAEKLLAVRSAVWLKFLDEWNAYLEERESAPDPTALTAPVFSSFTDLDDLLDKEGAPGYLPASFPVVNYSAVSLGNEIEVAVTPSNAVSATYVPNFLPMAEVSGGTVKLRITRPGASPEFGFFVEKNAANEMGSAGTLEWVDGQGKIAVNELESNIIRSQAGGGKIDFESTVMFGTIEGRGGASISVANTLDLGSNTLKTTGAGEFGTLSVTNTGTGAMMVAGRINAGSAAITGALTAASGTVTGALTVGSLNAGNTSITGTLGVSGMLSASGGIDAGGSNIKAGSGTFTGALSVGSLNANSGNITTTGRVTTGTLTINGKTGAASATAYNVWVGNANNATNASKLGGYTYSQVLDAAERRASAGLGPVGIPTLVVNMTSGSTTLSVTKGKWYKISASGSAGTGYSYYKSGSQGDNNPGAGAGEVQVSRGGTGAKGVFYFQAKNTTTWTIQFTGGELVATGKYYPDPMLPTFVNFYNGVSAEIKEGSTVILRMGGGGTGGSTTVYPNGAQGGNAGILTLEQLNRAMTNKEAVVANPTGAVTGGGRAGVSSYFNGTYNARIEGACTTSNSPSISIWVYD